MCKESNNIVESLSTDKYTIYIYLDECVESPRDWFDNFGTMVTAHKRYSFGCKNDVKMYFLDDVVEYLYEMAINDYAVCSVIKSILRHEERDVKKNHEINSYDARHEDNINDWIKDFFDPDDVIAIMRKLGYVILPLHIYDHGGVSMNTVSYTCPWDSGQVGFVYATPEKIKNEFKTVNGGVLQHVEEIISSEIATYSDYLEGEVYGFYIVDNSDNLIDSCGGFYGYESIREIKDDFMRNYS